jgi:acyl transferase domain-containing protein
MQRKSASGFTLGTLGALWQAGVKLDWSALHAGERLRRVPLPTYPFERKRYFLDPRPVLGAVQKAETGKRKEIAEWLYVPSWKRFDHVANSEHAQARWLFFADDGQCSRVIASRLMSLGHEVVTVRAGTGFNRGANGDYVVNPFSADDYRALFADLTGRGGLPPRIVSFFNVTSAGSDWDVGEGVSAEYPAFTSLLALSQVLATEGGGASSLFVVTNQTQCVTGEELIRPLKSLVLGLCKVIPQEFPHIRCRSVDLPTTDRFDDLWTGQIVDELCSDDYQPTVAYRGRSRWLPAYEPLKVDRTDPESSWLKERGVYLITGGLGSVGMLFAEHLARRCRARLVLLGRSKLPPREQWTAPSDAYAPDDPMAVRIARLRAMEALGAEVMVASADVADLEQMRSVLRDATSRFGRIDGVIHAAGATTGSFLTDIGAAQSDAHFRPKIRGVQVIEELLGDENLDFCLLISSLSSVLGGLGFGAYAAANCFLDAFAQMHWRRAGTPWRSVNWDGWNFNEAEAAVAGHGASVLALAMTPEESLRALDLIQSIPVIPQVTVSTGSLDTRLSQWVVREQLSVEEDRAIGAQHARPQLKSAYEPPRNDTEKRVVEIWSALLGIDQIGIHDNFFELGGHSLLGTRVLARVQESFDVKLPLRVIFEAPTSAEFAERIQAVLWAQSKEVDEGPQPEDLEELQF